MTTLNAVIDALIALSSLPLHFQRARMGGMDLTSSLLQQIAQYCSSHPELSDQVQADLQTLVSYAYDEMGDDGGDEFFAHLLRAAKNLDPGRTSNLRGVVAYLIEQARRTAQRVVVHKHNKVVLFCNMLPDDDPESSFLDECILTDDDDGFPSVGPAKIAFPQPTMSLEELANFLLRACRGEGPEFFAEFLMERAKRGMATEILPLFPVTVIVEQQVYCLHRFSLAVLPLRATSNGKIHCVFVPFLPMLVFTNRCPSNSAIISKKWAGGGVVAMIQGEMEQTVFGNAIACLPPV